MNRDKTSGRIGNSSLAPAASYEALLKRCVDRGLHRDRVIASSLFFLELDNEDQQLRELVMERVAEEDRIQLLDPNPFAPINPLSAADLPGSIGLGLIPPESVPWCITPELLTTHVLITARSGGGKSNLVFLILAQLLESRRYDQAI